MGFPLGLAIANTALSGVSSLLSYSGSRYSAKKAYKAQQEVNQLNYMMFKEQQKFALDSWNKQNAYDDPSAVRERLENAGYNPYSYFDQNSQSEGISQPAAQPAVLPSESAYISPSQVAAESFSNGIQNSIQSYASLQDLENRSLKNHADIQNILQSIEESKSRSGLNKRQLDELRWTFDTRDGLNLENLRYLSQQRRILSMQADNELERLQLQNAIMSADAALKRCDVASKTILNQYLDESEQQRLVMQGNEIVMQGIQQKLSYAQIRKELASTLKIQLEAVSQSQQNQVYADENLLNTPGGSLLRQEKGLSQVEQQFNNAELSGIQLAESQQQWSIDRLTPEQINSLADALFKSTYYNAQMQATSSYMFVDQNSYYNPNGNLRNNSFGRSVNNWMINGSNWLGAPIRSMGLSGMMSTVPSKAAL